MTHAGFAELVVGVETDEQGERSAHFEWTGPASAPVLVAKQLVDDLVAMAPWKLVVDSSRRSPVPGCFVMRRVP